MIVAPLHDVRVRLPHLRTGDIIHGSVADPRRQGRPTFCRLLFFHLLLSTLRRRLGKPDAAAVDYIS